jgi:hemoglobin
MQSDLEGRAAHNAEIQARAREQMMAIGVTPESVEDLVESFYARIRNHETLGLVFNSHIQDRWPEHMQRMKQFWNALAFKTGSYGGKPVQAHYGIHGITPELFPQWLQAFRLTLQESNMSEQAQEWFYLTAERIAKSLTLSLFYNPAFDDPNRTMR